MTKGQSSFLLVQTGKTVPFVSSICRSLDNQITFAYS